MAPETTLRTGSQKGERSFIHTRCKSFVMEALCTCRKTKSVSSSPPPCDRVGASEISDACKPLKKRSRASTDVEMASSQYRDTSDSDSRGLNDPQVALNDMTEGFFSAHKIFVSISPEAKYPYIIAMHAEMFTVHSAKFDLGHVFIISDSFCSYCINLFLFL